MTDEELDALDIETLAKAEALELNREALRQAVTWSINCTQTLSKNQALSNKFKVDPFNIVDVFHEFRKMLTEPL